MGKRLKNVAWLINFLVGLLLATPAASAVKGVPRAAAAAGYYQNTFSTEAFSSSAFNVGSDVSSGFSWYGWSFFKGDLISGASNVMINSDKSITIGATSIATAVRSKDRPLFKGIAFGGGGYFEAEIKFNHLGARGQDQWPAWWAMSIEHLAQMPPPYGRWSGRGGAYEHFGEIDFFEYNLGFGRKVDEYGATVHDWFGEFNVTCPKYCRISTGYHEATIKVPLGTDWGSYHRYAGLWVPATQGRPGRITFYFDGAPMRSFYWDAMVDNLSPEGLLSGRARQAFAVNDSQHFALILGGSAEAPITVRSVNVWQSSTSKNWTSR